VEGKNAKNNLSKDTAYKDLLKNIKEYLANYRTELSCIAINDRLLGNNEPVFIVAEAACNHMCDMELAKTMIDKASEAGADAIKFQTYKAEKLVTRNAVAFWGNEKVSQIEYYKKLDKFGKREYEELFEYARDKGIIAFSSPFDKESAEMLDGIGMPAFKIASCDIPDIRFLRYVAGFGKPIILSTGACIPEEIDRAIEVIFEQGNYQLILLACTLSYPTKYKDANLLRIQTLKERYPAMIVGLSDHTEPDIHMMVPSIAVALGAKVIEKHYTIDRTITGSGHFFAITPDDLKKMVKNIRLTEALLGDGSICVTKTEKRAWNNARRSIVAEVPIPEGTIITSEMLGVKRPGVGLSPSMIEEIIGKKAAKDIKADAFITLDMLK